jgi:peptidoglycan hydrolase-like protein with peptidoglycan-binding domain
MPASPVANTAVSASAFAGKVEQLRAAAILTSATDLRTLQRHLSSQSLYDGTASGRYDTKLRQAVEQYERREGMNITGLPTRTLLEALSRTASGNK